MRKILQKESSVLREKAREVLVGEIKSKKIKSVIKDMKEALAAEEDGVAIAAPQIGESLRIFVVSGKVFSSKETKKLDDLVFINPRVVKKSKEKVEMEEGCLSIRWMYGKVKRSKEVTVEAHNDVGELFTTSATELLAQIFQHEIEHLDGTLFTDKATDLKKINPHEQEEQRN